MIKRHFPELLAIITIILLWQLMSQIINSSLILPAPKETVICLIKMTAKADFWKNVAGTFMRVIIAFVITVISGVAAGILCGRNNFARKFLSVPISILRSTPVVSLILVLIFAFSSKAIPVIVAILMSLPVMITSISSGFNQTENDRKLFQMAEVFEYTKTQKIRYLWIPKLMPFFKSGIIAAFGMEWKVVAAGEVLTLPANALGTQMATAQVHLESTEVLALSIVIVILSFVMENLIKKILEKK